MSGIKVLAEGDNPYFDIIALHGLNGHREESWTHEESNILWLRDLLPEDVPRARILTYGYDSGTYNRPQHPAFHDVVKKFIEQLAAYRPKWQTDHRPIVFVAHDLGGIILKFALVYSFSHYESIPRSTFGVMFFGTPHYGTEVSKLKQFNLYPREIPSAYAPSDSTIIQDIQSKYQPISKDFNHVFFYETRPVVGTGRDAELLVPKHSAIIHGQSNSTEHGICGDHYSMVKFGSRDDDNYIVVCEALKTMADQVDLRVILENGKHILENNSEQQIMSSLFSPSQIVDGFNDGYPTNQAFLDAALLEKPFPKYSDQCLDGRIMKLGNHIVASGGFSDIWLGKLSNTKVAIKALKRFSSEGLDIPRDKMLKRLWREHLAWSSYRHPNILGYLGFSYDFGPATEFQVPALISPWMEHASPLRYISGHPGRDRMPMIKGLLSALIFLHNLSPPVVHGDIRASNILVSDEGSPLLTDSRLLRALGRVRGFTTSSKMAASLPWMAPELLRNERPNEKSDVWAFGMTMLEIFTEKRPYSGLSDVQVWLNMKNGTMPPRPEFPVRPNSSDLLWDTCTQCWRMEPHKRPALRQLRIADL